MVNMIQQAAKEIENMTLKLADRLVKMQESEQSNRHMPEAKLEAVLAALIPLIPLIPLILPIPLILNQT